MSGWAYLENIVIYLAIAAITIGGVWLTGTWWGLWSLVLLIGMNSQRKPLSNQGSEE